MNELAELLDQIGAPRLLVLGDLMLDHDTWGAAERVSQEAPVLVLRAEPPQCRAGGAAAVAVLARALGGEVTLAGVLGDDADGRRLHRLLEAAGVEVSAVLRVADRPTTRKERVLVRTPGGQPHPMLRLDRETREPLPADQETHLLGPVLERLGNCQALLISDYGKGVCTFDLVAAVVAAARERGLPVLIDPARMVCYGRYRHATLLAPNRAEAAEATGRSIRTPEEALRAGCRLCEHYDLGAVLIKLDRDGMALARNGAGGLVLPARARAVRDVTGAGDMVLAAAGLCLAGGMPLEETARVANAAAGLEVENWGVTPVGRAELRSALAVRLGGSAKIETAERMAALAEAYRRRGLRVVFTNGCFDLLHAGHVACLQEAAGLGDVLVVALNSDASVRRLKGPGRPVVGQEQRAALVAALGCVDHVLLFDDATPHELLRRLRPEVLVKGGTYGPEGVVGREVVEGYGGRVCVTGRVEGLSTTGLLQRLSINPPASPLAPAGAPAIVKEIATPFTTGD